MPTTIEYSFSWQLLDLNGVTLFDGHQLENSMYKDIGRLSLAKCYKICDASVRSFNGKTLTTCPTTTIVEIPDRNCQVHRRGKRHSRTFVLYVERCW